MKSPRLIALTQGDPAGIGPEITLKAWLAGHTLPLPFAVLSDPALLRDIAARLALPIAVETVATAAQAQAAFARALPVIPLSRAVVAEPGRPSLGAAASVLESIEAAVTLVKSGEAAALVTNPIAKEVLYRAGFPHPGHTEFLAALAAADGEAPHPVMMLWSESLAVVPVTVHIPLRDVPSVLTSELIVRTARIVAADLRRLFGLANPRLALTGLNPHAGESGTLGGEENAVIAPAVAALRVEGLDARGPFPADTMFHAAAREGYDVALAMYHDQALVPIKTIALDEAVNVTLGLPFIRTSPDHGTAFDIAGRGIARPDSLLAALRLAARLAGDAEP
jgi:4-hydroxythreonine-4-phosphate dehydrogenase